MSTFGFARCRTSSLHSRVYDFGMSKSRAVFNVANFTFSLFGTSSGSARMVCNVFLRRTTVACASMPVVGSVGRPFGRPVMRVLRGVCMDVSYHEFALQVVNLEEYRLHFFHFASKFYVMPLSVGVKESIAVLSLRFVGISAMVLIFKETLHSVRLVGRIC